MATRLKSTHQGICQVCGRLQCIVGHTMAKHGYVVAGFGFFNGTCFGSDEKPLQVERTLTDSIIKFMKESFTSFTKLEQDLTNKLVDPSMARTGNRIQVEETDGCRVYKVWKDEKGPYADQTLLHQQEARERAIWKAQRQAKFHIDHAMELAALAERYYKTSLIPIKQKEEKVTVIKPVVDITTGTIKGKFATKAARQDALDTISRSYEKAVRKIQAIYLALPHEERTEEMTKVYYSPQCHCWRPRHAVAALKCFPEAKELVEEIEQLIKAREAIKNA